MQVVKIISYGSTHYADAQAAIDDLKKILPSIECEFIGAAAVPMMGKEEIDVLAITDHLQQDKKMLEKNGYVVQQESDKKAYVHLRKPSIMIEIHLTTRSSSTIAAYRKLIERLQDPILRKKYEILKSSTPENEYKSAKSTFIEQLLK